MTQVMDRGWSTLLRWGPAVAGLMLVASLAVAGLAFSRDHAHEQAIDHERAIIVTAERLLSALKDVETGSRGFIITGHEAYLGPYQNGLSGVATDERALAALRGETSADLDGLIAARLKDAADGIALYKTEGGDAARADIATDEGKHLMDRVRLRVADIQAGAESAIRTAREEGRTDDGLRLGSLIGFIVSCAILAALALLRRREQQAMQHLFEGVLENAPVGLGILDRSLRIRHINPSLTRMSERALSALPGMLIWDVIPDLRSMLEGRLQRVVDGGRATNVELDAASNTKAGEVRSYQATFYPLTRSVGAPDGVGMVIADITARKRAERATQESEERFRSLIEASAAMIWTTDADG
ncbi:MAG: CHASE3 domain-containing protein, partial [Caulobacteraceae bacterium]|nr:CHASE3 domain-containing protein [Caulobacter sp.]